MSKTSLSVSLQKYNIYLFSTLSSDKRYPIPVSYVRLGVGDEEKREVPTRIVFPAIDGGASSNTGVSRSFYSSFNTCNGAKDFFRSGTGPPTFTATDISAGEQHSLVSGNGACFAFGSNEYGQCGIGSPTTTEMAMTPVLIPIPEGVTVKAIAAGGRHSAAITQCGKFLLFGWGEDAQCTQVTTRSLLLAFV